MAETDLQRILGVFGRHPEIRLAILFGSVAAACARPDSDVDLAVGTGSALTSVERMALILELAEATGRPVDLIDLKTVGEPLLGQILTRGRRLVGDDAEFARLLMRHLVDDADFLPYRRRILAERRQAWIGK